MTLGRLARGLPALALLATGIHACAAPGPASPPTSDPRFDWFVYQGDDEVFRAITPGADQYRNPILAGFYPDPSVCRVGDDYYLVTSSFSYFPGIPIFHSRDLVHWTQLGHVLDRPSQLDLDGAGISRGVFAPAIRWHDGTFYVINTLVDRGGTFVVTATDPAGPWSDPVWLRDVDGIDPSLFWDDDGRVYIVNNGPPVGTPLYDGHRALWLREVNSQDWTTIGRPTVIVNGGTDLAKRPIWIEAPHLFQVAGTYYLIAAEGGTGDRHSEVVFRSPSVRGPYRPYAGNPILTQRQLDPARRFPVTSTGHADFVEAQNGEWWAVFLGTRPYEDDRYNTGRETYLLPVHWVDGWPVILTGSSAVPYVAPRPQLPVQPGAVVPHTGNFTVRDDFAEAELPPYWNLMRTPRERWYDLGARPGWLSLKARPGLLSGRGQPSFVGRRQQHARATATTAMQYRPARAGDEAGLAAFQNEAHYYLLAVAWTDSGPALHLERRAGSDSAVIASVPLALPASGLLYLRIAARGARYDFSYAYDPAHWTMLLADADGTILSTKVAGGFVGAYFGLYAHAGAP